MPRSIITLITAAALTATTLGIEPASAEPDYDAANCKRLKKTDFSTILDAPTQVLSSSLVKADRDAPAHCQVKAYVSPNVGIGLLLPLSNWNGKFLQISCGGWCGSIHWAACHAQLYRGYACVTTDAGRKSTAHDYTWGYHSLQADTDYAYRSTHITAVAGKAITQRYYGRAPDKSYFTGCSGGGREGLMLAQRFPWDFDGIISGSPALSLTGGIMSLLWRTAVTSGEDGQSILQSKDIKLLHNTILAQCDMDDGVKDGVIGNPAACQFNLEKLVCDGEKKATCLTKRQITAVEKIYSGPKTSTNHILYSGGPAPGSELNWFDNPGTKYEGQSPSALRTSIPDLFRYDAFIPDQDPTWAPAEFNFDRNYKHFDMMESLYSAANPDLRRFKARGGKLIVYHGWADQTIAPNNTIDYYHMVENTMGGRAETQSFFRLFMLPGVNHCVGGAGADKVDYLDYLDKWVEQDKAPDIMISARLKPMEKTTATAITLPLTPSSIEFSRPLFPYPFWAKYSGSGDPSSADSFVMVETYSSKSQVAGRK